MGAKDEDIEFRRYEIRCRQYEYWCRWVDTQRLEMEGKAKQLEQISTLSALLGGFSLTAMCQMNIPQGVNGYLLIVFGITVPAAVGFALSAMLTSTLVLVAIMKYNPRMRQQKTYPNFSSFWVVHCEGDWRFCFRCFNYSIALFLTVLALCGWIVLQGHSQYRSAASLITTIAVCSGGIYYFYSYRKWSSFLSQLNYDDPAMPPERHFAGVLEDWGEPPVHPSLQGSDATVTFMHAS